MADSTNLTKYCPLRAVCAEPTINSECQRAQFLLLTPFIDNARDVARWLGGQNSEDISLALDWQPNDRVIGIVQAEKGAILQTPYLLSPEIYSPNSPTLNCLGN